MRCTPPKGPRLYMDKHGERCANLCKRASKLSEIASEKSDEAFDKAASLCFVEKMEESRNQERKGAALLIAADRLATVAEAACAMAQVHERAKRRTREMRN